MCACCGIIFHNLFPQLMILNRASQQVKNIECTNYRHWLMFARPEIQMPLEMYPVTMQPYTHTQVHTPLFCACANTHNYKHKHTHIAHGVIRYIGIIIVGVISGVVLAAGVIVFASVGVKKKRKAARILQDQLDQSLSLSTRYTHILSL